MFDLMLLDHCFNDDGHQAYLLLIIDHFTKYKWGTIIYGKNPHAVAGYLFEVFSTEGTPERWHCDNGTEFVNTFVELAREKLGLGNLEGLMPYTHGGVR